MKKTPSTKIIILSLIIGVTILGLAFFLPGLLVAIFILSIIGASSYIYYFQPYSEFRHLRKNHPIAKNEIDHVEKKLAQSRADLKARELIIHAELTSLIDRLKSGRAKLMEIDSIRLNTNFQENKDLANGFSKMSNKTIEDVVKVFLELTSEEKDLYLTQTRQNREEKKGDDILSGTT